MRNSFWEVRHHDGFSSEELEQEVANVASSYYSSKQGPTSLARRGNKAGAACTAFVQNFYVYSAGVEEGREEGRRGAKKNPNKTNIQAQNKKKMSHLLQRVSFKERRSEITHTHTLQFPSKAESDWSVPQRQGRDLHSGLRLVCILLFVCLFLICGKMQHASLVFLYCFLMQ